MKLTTVVLAAVSVGLAQQAEWQQCVALAGPVHDMCVWNHYSQCLPGTATTTAARSPTSSPISSPTTHTCEWSTTAWVANTAAWQLMTPTLGGTIDPTFFSRYDTTVQAALSSGPDVFVIIDLHNYARWNGGIIGQGGPTNDQFASIWTQLAAKYGTNERVIFGIMNEPHDIPDIATWVDSVQYVVNAVRPAGSNNLLLLPGSSYSSAEAFPTEAGPLLVQVTDPLGDTSKLIFDVHKYLDSDNSGTHPDCVTNNVDVLTTLVTFLQTNGNRQAILSETGGGNTASCETDLGQELAFVKSSFPTLAGFSIWAAGAFDTTYVLTVTPNANGTDQPLWIDAVQPNLPTWYDRGVLAFCKANLSAQGGFVPLHRFYSMAPTKGRNPNPSGLGRAIINKKVKDAREARISGLYTTDIDPNRLQSITQERDLDEFLNTATLAGTQFTAERRNVKIISAPTLRKHQENKQRLRVPRRPSWTKDMTTAELDRQEKDAFLDWRRGLADLQERDSFLLTPFERNLEVWRQLWRVMERSHLIVQIVDARNPLRFRCEDLEAYVQDVEGAEGEKGTGKGKRRSLLLINKADLLNAKQRRLWADYFDREGVQYAFFSAANAAALQQARREAVIAEEAALEAAEAVGAVDDEHRDRGFEGEKPALSPDEADQASSESESDQSDDGRSSSKSVHGDHLDDEESDDDNFFLPAEDSQDGQDPRIKVLSVLELEDLFVRMAPELSTFTDSSDNHPTKLVIGLVGYPNVGKSSTINALIGEKKVSVSSTPGKTKHFQTIHLSSSLVLCDCPGLVFPQFATTKAALVCDGVLPIDQMREHTGPTALVVKRIPKHVLEAIYGLSIKAAGADEGGDGQITASDFLVAYAIARGFMRSGQGNPDEARAARYILKDYVNGKVLFCHPPPDIDEDDFNAETRQMTLERAIGKKRAPTTRVVKGADTFVDSNVSEPHTPSSYAPTGPSFKSRRLDQEFFATNSSLSAKAFMEGSTRHGQAFTRPRLYPHQNSVADDGTPLSGRRARIAAVLASAGGEVGQGKKHHKKMKRVKQRSGKGYD
ncbi:Large subunit GTPase 1 [Grifola frondosa]|uniref:Large subunit GTPase 1 n=1 Tax=Grifola frondosa TaxID=5627 RepID=A0A1C7MU36_GRIFR|nr:Large subunit GTPase 1 [Grifola frondosa]